MQSSAITPDEYIEQLPQERQDVMRKLRTVILKNMPEGYVEIMSYGMIGYVVPHALYPPGYHCDPKLPLPFLAIASQKNFVSLYHMGIYADKNLHDWFTAEYPNYATSKLDMGKSCIRFKKIADIPYDLIGALVKKMEVKDWISIYEANFKR